MHIITVHVAVATASSSKDQSFLIDQLYELHAIHGGYIDFAQMAKMDPTVSKTGIKILPGNHADFRVSIEAFGLRDWGNDGEEGYKFLLQYNTPIDDEHAGSNRTSHAIRIYIYADVHGVIHDVEFA